ncbi:hypothetical protein [Sinorhizobium sp. BG8]|uniref:hypothetical protein n=1 Tax=Sinorhizobium sp. BG8 TaxID=2613773 RepID=UPI00193CE4AD|nr:hypothetical protein [Sinorhizobium sp. BG8]QRM56299.1 hypothetical protein F3Y30_18465 [Sinorhizobium sp. BG8]
MTSATHISAAPNVAGAGEILQRPLPQPPAPEIRDEGSKLKPSGHTTSEQFQTSACFNAWAVPEDDPKPAGESR